MDINELKLIPLNEIKPHPNNRRIGGFDQEKLEQLSESIKAVGVLQPITVRLKALGEYEIVFAYRHIRLFTLR